MRAVGWLVVVVVLAGGGVIAWQAHERGQLARWESFAEALGDGAGDVADEVDLVVTPFDPEPELDTTVAQPPAPSTDPRVADLVTSAGAALDEGRSGDAVTALEAALAILPDSPVLARNLAYALYRRSEDLRAELRLDAAAGDLTRAVELAPDEPGYAAHLGNLYLRRYRLTEADDVLGAAVERHPESGDLWLLAADTRTLMGDLPAAIDAYRLAVTHSDGERRGVAQTLLERAERQWAVEKDYLTDTTSSFVIRSPNDPSAPLWGPQLAGQLERARAEVGNALGTFPSQRATVILYDRETFREVTGTHDWVGGLFDRKIRLSIRDEPLEAQRDAIESTFRHEYAHFIVSEIAPRCPAVLNEGIAQYVEHGRGNGLAMLVQHLDARGLSRESIPSVAELPETFLSYTSQADVSLAYLVSYAFIDHVVNMHGTIGVTGWLRELNVAPLGEAYGRANGRTLPAEEALFRELVRTER